MFLEQTLQRLTLVQIVLLLDGKICKDKQYQLLEGLNCLGITDWGG